jgi:hypothetical protein
VLARFSTAARALWFAEQAMQADSITCGQADADHTWWIAARLTLGSAREMAGLDTAQLYVHSGDDYVADRGWGDDPGPGPLASFPDITEVPLLELVRAAGLHPVPARPAGEVCVLMPGYLVASLLKRALDAGLRVTYQQVRLEPLFDSRATTRVCYAVRLAVAKDEQLPVTLLTALRDDPFAIVCREVEQVLLIRYGAASPLSDRAIARLVTAAGDGTWLLADPPDGCARLTWRGEPLDAANFVRLGPAHALTDLTGEQPWTESPTEARNPLPRTLTLARATTRQTSVDAVLLDDADLECLPLLLAGEPIADSAFLIRGRDRHLLSAPGGLLTDLPVGEPLHCVGPGSIYLQVGYRLDPPVGPAARAALFEPDTSTAQVILRDTRLVYDLDRGEPVWRLWAGPVPALDAQLPRSAMGDLDQVAREVGEPVQAPERPRGGLLDRIRRPQPATPPAEDWRREAWQAEQTRDYVAAAQLYIRHNEPLRAARMWEREAEEKY